MRKPMRVRISRTRAIGDNEPCFIIADVGSNHNRDFALAKRLIDKVAASGADAVKFQTYSAETLYSQYTPAHSKYTKLPWKLIKDIELPRHWQAKLKSYAEKKGIIFFSTPFDFTAVDELNNLGVALFKMASAELTDLGLIRHIAQMKKPLIISTGMASVDEIKDACRVCEESGNRKLVLLQCTTSYPAGYDTLNLRAMDTLRRQFGYVTGLSDHSLGIHIPVAAVALGAKVIEKHFTLSRKLKGPDHSFAVEPLELRTMVEYIRDTELALGKGKKTGPIVEERENYRIGRRSIHAKIDIPKGAKLTSDILLVKRPAYGIKPNLLKKVIGRIAVRDIKADEWITPGDIG
jgi:sialic acid synthase SpsE